MNNVIENALEKYQDENPSLKLELLKTEINVASIKYSIRKAKSKNNVLEVLDRKIKKLEENLVSESDNKKREKIHKDLETSKQD